MKEKILLIIPAFNEEFIIGKSLEVALECKRLGIVDDFILLNDRSEDHTVEVARKSGAIVKNSFFRRHGKGECFLTALAHCLKKRATILAMMDADITQATPQQIMAMIGELKANPAVKMAVHPVNEGYLSQGEHDTGQKLSGARAIQVGTALRLLLDKDFAKACMGFGLEVTLNWWIPQLYGKNSVVFMPEGRHEPIIMQKHLRRPEVFMRENRDISRAAVIIAQRRQKMARTASRA